MLASWEITATEPRMLLRSRLPSYMLLRTCIRLGLRVQMAGTDDMEVWSDPHLQRRLLPLPVLMSGSQHLHIGIPTCVTLPWLPTRFVHCCRVIDMR